MGKERITISVDQSLVKRIDQLVDKQNIRNRSHAVETLIDQLLPNPAITTGVIFIGGENVSANQLHITQTVVELQKHFITTFHIVLGYYASRAREILGDGSQWQAEFKFHQTENGSGGGLREIAEQLPARFAVLQLNRSIPFDWSLIQQYHERYVPHLTLYQEDQANWIGLAEHILTDALPQNFNLLEDHFDTWTTSADLIVIPSLTAELQPDTIADEVSS